MTPVRQAALEALHGAKGVFLRCDRGNGLYVSNAPVRMEKQADWAEAGFICRSDGRLAFLVPEERWNEALQSWLETRVRAKRLAHMLKNADFGENMEEDMALFIEGIKRLEMRGDAREYERMVRQRAAVCLREKQGGGTLISCALMVDLMNEGGLKDED